MEKLVELLNQFEKEKIINEWWSVDEDDNYFWRSVENWKIVNRDYDPDAHSFMNEYIISKKYEFIKWLVEKNKIDFSIMRISPWYELYENFIMYLSIQDDPIKYLIAYLK